MSLGLHVPHGEGKTVWFDGLTITVKVAAEQAGGSMGLVTASIPPGTGPSAHAHPDADETFYVLDGELEFLAGDRIFTGRPGDAIYIPHTTRHHVKNVGILPARVLFFYTPGGPEGLFVEAGEEPVPGVQVQPWSPEQAGDRLSSLLIEEYGTQMLPEL